MSTLNIPFLWKIEKTSQNYCHLLPDLAPYINPQWLELPMSRTNFYGPKDVCAIEARL